MFNQLEDKAIRMLIFASFISLGIDLWNDLGNMFNGIDDVRFLYYKFI